MSKQQYIIPDGYKRCNCGDNCAHPEGPILPKTTEYFAPRPDRPVGYFGQCRACTNAAREQYRRNRGIPERTPYNSKGEKRCSQCRDFFPLTEEYYGKKTASKSGFQSRCRKCQHKNEELKRRSQGELPRSISSKVYYSKKPHEYHALAEVRGIHWLGPEVFSMHDVTQWECPNGHIFESNYANVSDLRTKNPCQFCAGTYTKTEADYHRLAEQRGGMAYLGPLPESVQHNTNWQCLECGNIWSAKYTNIKHGKGCPPCAYKRGSDKNRTKADAYRARADELNIKWLDPQESLNRKARTQWQCLTCNYIWTTSLDSLAGCPNCSGVAPVTAGDYAYLAEQADLFWLGPMPRISTDKTRWQCQTGHEFERAYDHMRTTWTCPICKDYINGALVSQRQRELCDMLSGELNRPISVYSIDIAISRKRIQIAVEYDAYYWHAGKEDRDARKDTYLLSRGWRILRVKSNNSLPTLAQLNAAIALLLTGETYTEIVLPDWGIGPTFHNED